MRWLISNWRLKLLALALTLGLLGAVAFSENPVTATGVPVAVDYDNRPSSVVIVNPVLVTTMNVVGLSSVINPLRATSGPPVIHARVDLKNVGAKDYGKQITFSAGPKTLPAGVSWTGDPVQVTVGVDQMKTETFGGDPYDQNNKHPIQVRTPKIATGLKRLDKDPGGKLLTYTFCGNPQQPCQVAVTAPASVLDSLSAYVQVDDVTGSETSPNQPVRFEQNGKQVDLTKLSLLPPPGVDPPTVTVQVTVQQTQVSRQVALSQSVVGKPACGFAVTGINFAPAAFVTITGAADKIATIDSITLPRTVDMAGATADVRINQNVPTDNFTANPSAVTVTVTVQKQIDCSPPTPSPSPSHS